ncbi:MAG: Arm DNA-binding domain-containing protein [Pseudorhodoferax sp.]
MWHFRCSWLGKRERFTFGGDPALSLKQARDLRDEARTQLAKGLTPQSECKRKRHAIVLAGEHTFVAVHEKWLPASRRSCVQQWLDRGAQGGFRPQRIGTWG